MAFGGGSCGDNATSNTSPDASPDAPTGGELVLRAGRLGGSGHADDVGANARFSRPQGVAVDPTGNIFVVEAPGATIRRIAPGGVVSTFAGRDGEPGSVDGTGDAARFQYPTAIVSDAAGNLYVADSCAIRKVTPTAMVTTIVSGCGSIVWPNALAIEPSGSLLVVQTESHTVRRVTLSGDVITIAGAAGEEGSADNTVGTLARFNHPGGIAMDSEGNAYVTDTWNGTIRKITPTGSVSTFAGAAGDSRSVDGTLASARFQWPSGIATAASGDILVADSGEVIRRIAPSGMVSTLAGTADAAGSVDGTGPAARFGEVAGLTVDKNGIIVAADSLSATIRLVTLEGVVTTLAGLGPDPNDPFIAMSMAAGSNGDVLVVDAYRLNTLRRISSTGQVTTIQGERNSGVWHSVAVGPSGIAYAGSLSAIFRVTPEGESFLLESLFRNVVGGLGTDQAGNLLVAALDDHVVRRFDPEHYSGFETVIAGGIEMPGYVDGPAQVARFRRPHAVAADRDGNVFVADSGNAKVRKITAAGVVTTVTSLQPQENGFAHIAVDSAGNLYVADYRATKVRKISPDGEESVVVGSGNERGVKLGPLPARLNSIYALAVAPNGNLLIASEGAVLEVTRGR